MNPNVAIELGYALKALDWPKIVPVMNEAYGSIDRMPFDVDRTRRWAVTYNLKEGASNADIEAARKRLADEFVYILKSFVVEPPKAPPFAGTEPRIPPGLFFSNGDQLAVLKNHPSSPGQETGLFGRW